MRKIGFVITIFIIIGSLIFLISSVPEIKYISPPKVVESSQEAESKNVTKVEIKDGLYAEIITTQGKVLTNLEFTKAPGTVGNFVGLAEGNLKNSIYNQGKPYYNGLPFYNVVPNFYIETGDPLGTGFGGPGYEFADEFHPELNHSEPGVLAMISRGLLALATASNVGSNSRMLDTFLSTSRMNGLSSSTAPFSALLMK